MNGFHSDRVKLVALFLFWLLDCVLCSEGLFFTESHSGPSLFSSLSFVGNFILGPLSRGYFCVLRMAFYLIFLAPSDALLSTSLPSLGGRPPHLSPLPRVTLQAPEADSSGGSEGLP